MKKKRKPIINKLFPNYHINKRLINACFVVMLLLFVMGWFQQGFGNPLEPDVYLECPEEGGRKCSNPLWTACNVDSWRSGDYEICSYVSSDFYAHEFMKAGETFGEKPTWLMSNLPVLFILVLVSGLLINHFAYNKGYDFKGGKK